MFVQKWGFDFMSNKRSFVFFDELSSWIPDFDEKNILTRRTLKYIHPLSIKPIVILTKAQLLALNGRCIGDLSVEEQHYVAFMVFRGRQFNLEVQLKYHANDFGVSFESMDELDSISRENKVLVSVRQINSVVCHNCGEKIAI